LLQQARHSNVVSSSSSSSSSTQIIGILKENQAVCHPQEQEALFNVMFCIYAKMAG